MGGAAALWDGPGFCCRCPMGWPWFCCSPWWSCWQRNSPPHRWKAQEVGAAAALPGASGTHPGQLSRRLLLAGEPLQAALPGWAAGALFPHPQGTSELPEECSFLPFQSTYRLLTVQRRLSEVGSVKIMTKPLPSRAMRSDPSPGMVPFLKHWTEILPLS